MLNILKRRGSGGNDVIQSRKVADALLTSSQALKSGNIGKQISAMNYIFEIVKSSAAFPSQSVLGSVIESGLSSENNEIREKSFRLIQYLYIKKRSFLWNDIRATVMTELSTAECENCLSAAIAVLASVDDRELISFFCSKEGMSVVKSCCNFPQVELRRTSIVGLGNLLFRVWCLLIEEDLEGLLRCESITDARRLKEDYCDFVGEMAVLFSDGVLGKFSGTSTEALEDCFSSFEGSCETLVEVRFVTVQPSEFL